MKVYVVTMRRWGSDDTHNYVLGVYDNKVKALYEGLKHQRHRGNKYQPDIQELEINQTQYSSED